MIKKVFILLLLFSGSSLAFIFFFISKESSDITVLNVNSTKVKEDLSQSLSYSAVDHSVFKRKSQIQSCLKNKKIYGYLKFDMNISKSGSNKISSIQSDLQHQGLIQCIIFMLEKIKFSSFKGQKITRTYTIQFLPKK